MYSLFIDITIR